MSAPGITHLDKLAPPRATDRRPVGGVAGIRLTRRLVAYQFATALAGIAMLAALLLRALGLWNPPGLLIGALAVLTGGGLLAVIAVLFELSTDTWFRLNLFSRRRLQRRVAFPLAFSILVLAAFAVAGQAWAPGALPVVLALLLAAAIGIAGISLSLHRGISSYSTRRDGYVDIWESCLADSDPGTAERLQRVAAFVEREKGSGSQAAYSTNCGFALPGLVSAPFHDRDRFPWIPALEERFPEIRREILNALKTDEHLRPYPFVENGRWQELAFYKGGQRIDEHCAECPLTVQLVEEHIPGGTVREAMVSILEPGGHIPPHLDHAIPMLTCHLGLVIPPRCGIRVGSESRGWEEGRCLILDTSYEHEAWNSSDQRRAVLLVDFWPPDLTDDEREFFSRAFELAMRPHLTASK